MNRELLMLVDSIAREKNVEREVVFSALESALEQVTKKQFEDEVDIKVNIDRQTGAYETLRRWLVVPDEQGLQEPEKEILHFEAAEQIPDIEIGDHIEEVIESAKLGRIGAMTAKQVILQKIREAEREALVNDYLERGDKVFLGNVKRVDRNEAIVEAGRLEAKLRRSEMIPKENLRSGDRVKAYILEVADTVRGPQIMLSRTAPEFMMELFKQEVPEIGQNLLEIKSCARDPGSRAKIAVQVKDPRIDPIGTCVGVRGSRVNSVTNELAGEKIDIVLWDADPAKYIINSLSPAVVKSIVIDEEKQAVDVVVDEENLAIAIGRGGQNVRLASDLTGWKINIMDASESEEKQQEEVNRLRELFCSKLDVEQDVADILIEEGFSSIEEVAYVPIEELLEIAELDEEMVNELRSRAKNSLLIEEIATQEVLNEVADDLKDFVELGKEQLVKLAEANIKSKEDLAELATDELVEIIGCNEEFASQLIMKAREDWFKDEQ